MALRKRPRIAVFLGAVLSVLSVVESHGVVYVDTDRPGGDGTSWLQAYNSLQTAINSRGTDEEFWVAEGTYRPTSPLWPKARSLIYGGFAGTESALGDRNISAHPTIIDGGYSLPHVIFLNENAWDVRLDGLTIQRGNAHPGSGWDAWGGGVFVNLRPCVIVNCTFKNNTATVYGGGLFVNRVAITIAHCTFEGNVAPSGGALGLYDSDSWIWDCTFRDNRAEGGTQPSGGGVWGDQSSPAFDDCTFERNTAYVGGAISFNNGPGRVSNTIFTANSTSHCGAGSSVGGAIALNAGSLTLLNSRFESNNCNSEGGGVYSYYAPVTIRDCEFVGNYGGYGGAVMLDYKLGTIDTIERCRFLGNDTTVQGGALHSYARSVYIDNCVFAYNTSDLWGGALGAHAGEPGQPTRNPNYVMRLRNCVAYGNWSGDYGGAMVASYCPMNYLYNCVFWGNSGGGGGGTRDIANSGSSSMTLRYCDMETLNDNHHSAAEYKTGCFQQAPDFVDPNGSDNIGGTLDDDFRLNPGSPCLDHADGNNAPALDILRHARVDVPGVANQGTGSPNYGDVGAYERIEQVVAPEFAPDGGTFTAIVNVTMSTATSGATIRYTTDGSTPTGSSPAGTSVELYYTTTLRARAYKGGMLESDVTTDVYTQRDQDTDGLPDWVEDGGGVYHSPTNTGTRSNDSDSDNDNLTDGDEVTIYGTDPNTEDSDSDNLDDDEELLIWQTNPNDPDHDDDGLLDGDEVHTHSTDPKDADSDDDGLSDGAEVQTHLTNPNDPDHDDDGLTDGEEVLTYLTNPKDADHDDDGLEDGEEVLTYSTDPKDDDSDDDGLLDGAEVQTHFTNPNNDDTDGDTLLDGWEVDHGYNPLGGDARIQGTVAYSGGETGVFVVMAFSDTGYNDESGRGVLGAPGPYDIGDLMPGTYYVGAALATGGDPDRIKPMDPWGVYMTPTSVTAVVVGPTQVLAGIDFGLEDAVPGGVNPFRSGMILNDFDGDGRSDLGVYYPPGGNWYVLKTTEGFDVYQFGFSGTIPISGDYDGDGRTDFGVYYPPTGMWYVMKSLEGFTTYQFGYTGTVPISGDFDGDGRCDFGVYYPPGGNWYVMKSQEGFDVYQFGYSGTLPITGDMDGDGKCDFGVYYPPGGNWYVMKSAEGFDVYQFGYTGTVPITGDMDGDGRCDFGVYYPPGGNWYVMKSTEGFDVYQFGYSGTVPLVGDYDGDGRDDFGVYYAPGGNWYVMRSTEGFWITQFGYAGTVALGAPPMP